MVILQLGDTKVEKDRPVPHISGGWPRPGLAAPAKGGFGG